MTLPENVQEYVKILGDSSLYPGRKVEVLENRSTRIAGVPAVLTRVSLEDRKGVRAEESLRDL